jgi:uncharacterized protein
LLDRIQTAHDVRAAIEAIDEGNFQVAKMVLANLLIHLDGAKYGTK